MALRKTRGKWIDVVDRIKNFETPERLKGTFVERWGKYWRNVYLDYEEVAMDIVKGCKTRPIRATLYTSSGACYLVNNNPDEISYRQELLRNTTRVASVGEYTRNPKAERHIRFLEQCYNENIVRRLDLGVLSLAWIDNYDSGCAHYRATCTYLKPRFVTFHRRIIDVGFLNTWWVWENRMRDYDINSEEFS